MTLVIGTPPRAVADGIVVVPLTGRNVLPLHAMWDVVEADGVRTLPVSR